MAFAQLLGMLATDTLTFIVGHFWQATLGLIVSYLVYMFLYAFFLSPVRHIPGPWWARVSKLPLLWATFQRRRSKYAAALIDQYGPIVVIAPNQVHTNDESAMKVIYNRTSTKTSFYKSMGSWKGVTTTLGFIDYPTAAPTRNNLLQCFQNRNLERLVDNMARHITEFCQLLSSSVQNKSNVDGVVVFRLLALDIVTDVLWGEQKTLISQASESTPVFLQRFHAFSSWNALVSFMPLLDKLVQLVGTRKLRQLRRDCHDMDITAHEALTRWQTSAEGRHDKDVLSMLQSMNQLEDPRKRIPSEHIPAFIVEMLAAGSSTTSHTAAFACHQLAMHPAAQAALHEELCDAFPDASTIDERKMLDLPLLDGVLRETMRLFPMIPGPLERYLGDQIEIAGLKVPPGVIASTSALDQGRLEEVFPAAQQWKPERWINATERMRLNWIPFGHGSRSCPGANLAVTELKYILGTVFRHFDVVLPAGHESDELELADVFAAGARSGHVWLKFLPLEPGKESLG
ncbi:cytochrome P450 [Aspergillus bertholletiae]|uniref:Cytochrome P450 n=1 Tax=Aspergillus bertholletiae TaxID=1226010 RepID=A0A5N7ATC2_9EURO|nr:cytochrome P450 [Aspergillus bertholletiae]